MPTKVLIIKIGYSETLDQEIGRVPSLGDVLRTTPVLYALKERFPDCHISWLVSHQAEPLLNGNKLIDRIITWDEFVPFQLMREKFDVLINLEKIAGLCALSDMIDAWVKYGFRFDSINGLYNAYEKGISFVDYIEEKKRSNKSKDLWQKVLVEMLGVEWKGQEYMLGYKPVTEETFDVGFNIEVGSKWQSKALPLEYWKDLEKLLVNDGYTVTWQKGKSNLYEYIDWLNSCRLIISNDSLGLHLSFPLKKKTIGIFGPTDPDEVYFYNNGRIIKPRMECPLMPCYGPRCLNGMYCMSDINVLEIKNAVDELMERNKESILTNKMAVES